MVIMIFLFSIIVLVYIAAAVEKIKDAVNDARKKKYSSNNNKKESLSDNNKAFINSTAAQISTNHPHLIRQQICNSESEKQNQYKQQSPEIEAMRKRLMAKYNVVSKNGSNLTVEINGHQIKYIDSSHSYYVEGQQVPSVTSIIKKNGFNPSSYDTIDPAVLQRAAIKGTHMHNVIEQFENYGIESYEPELLGYKRLKREKNIEPVISELLLAIFDENGIPVCAGRLDFVVYNDNDSVGIIDLKRTSKYHSDTVLRQLNLYRIGFMQCFDIAVNKLACLRLRYNVAEYHSVIISQQKAYEVLYKETNNSKFLMDGEVKSKTQQSTKITNATEKESEKIISGH